jgi:hypothetical protein
MPDPIEFPRNLKEQGWKAKIYNNERLEPPHLTLIRYRAVWRIGLRDWSFMDPPGGKWKDIDPNVAKFLEDNRKILRAYWDRLHPTNPVPCRDEVEDGG